MRYGSRGVPRCPRGPILGGWMCQAVLEDGRRFYSCMNPEAKNHCRDCGATKAASMAEDYRRPAASAGSGAGSSARSDAHANRAERAITAKKTHIEHSEHESAGPYGAWTRVRRLGGPGAGDRRRKRGHRGGPPAARRSRGGPRKKLRPLPPLGTDQWAELVQGHKQRLEATAARVGRERQGAPPRSGAQGEPPATVMAAQGPPGCEVGAAQAQHSLLILEAKANAVLDQLLPSQFTTTEEILALGTRLEVAANVRGHQLTPFVAAEAARRTGARADLLCLQTRPTQS